MIALAGLLAEPLGAAGLAGAWLQRDCLEGRRIVVVVSGADMSRTSLGATLAAVSLLAG